MSKLGVCNFDGHTRTRVRRVNSQTWSFSSWLGQWVCPSRRGCTRHPWSFADIQVLWSFPRDPDSYTFSWDLGTAFWNKFFRLFGCAVPQTTLWETLIWERYFWPQCLLSFKEVSESFWPPDQCSWSLKIQYVVPMQREADSSYPYSDWGAFPRKGIRIEIIFRWKRCCIVFIYKLLCVSLFFIVVLGMEPRALCVLSTWSTTELHPQHYSVYFISSAYILTIPFISFCRVHSIDNLRLFF